MSIKDVTIVITSFQSNESIIRCLNSISTECKIINIENSSNQKHKTEIEKNFKNVECILTGQNLGYGKANNLALKKVKTKYALILNPDTELFSTTLNSFLSVANEKADFAIIGPSIIEKKNNQISKIVNTKKLEVISVKEVKGYAMFMNLSKFKEIGYFDENIFFFLEEVDLCRRLINKKEKIYFCPDIPIYHAGGKSHDSLISYEMELSRNWHWMWSSFYYNKKYYGFVISFLKIIPKILKSLFKMLFYSIFFNKIKRSIYFNRLSGLINSILGKKSWYRPKI